MSQDILIIVSLRGGVDALNMIVPYRDENYYRQRPSLSIARPGEKGRTALDLDGFYGLHPSLAPLMPLYQRGEMAILHAVGWPGDSHSHFEAWDQIESGTLGETRATTGWLARYLQLRATKTTTPLRAVAFGEMLPKLLTGALGVSALRSLEDYRLNVKTPQTRNALRQLYQLYRNSSRNGSDNNSQQLGALGLQTIDVLETIDQLKAQTQNRRQQYPKTDFGAQLQALEQLIHANVGLEAASVELGGWDTHIMQGTTEGQFSNLLTELANGLSVFTGNLKDQMDNIVIVVMSEFGRRVGENGSGGTDHGQAGAMLFCGGKVRGGQVYGDWPGLADSKLVGPGDLAITTDFRDALGEIIDTKLGTKASEQIFPNYRKVKQLGLLGS